MESFKPIHGVAHRRGEASSQVTGEACMVDDEQTTTDLQFDKPLQGRQAAIVSRQVISVRQGIWCRQRDQLVAEEPMEIQVGGPGQEMVSLAVTMRTPGHDVELAIGFLYAEGLIGSCADILAVHAGDRAAARQTCNIVEVRLARPFDLTAAKRHFTATSSCGLCGKVSIQQVAMHCRPVASGPVVDSAVLMPLPAALRQTQQVFEQTGGLHAAGVFDQAGRLLSMREDIGRHNAVDKLIGQMLQVGEVPLRHHLLLVSGRVSFEIVQKAAMGGVPILCAVSAASSLAIEAAQQFNMTLVGFLRDQSYNIYTHPERIALECSKEKASHETVLRPTHRASCP
jgi:FdhD protein